MERTPVSSSAIQSVGYDTDSQTMEIEFNGGRTYQYFDVPAAEHEALMEADSHGAYFNVHIKGHYVEVEL